MLVRVAGTIGSLCKQIGSDWAVEGIRPDSVDSKLIQFGSNWFKFDGTDNMLNKADVNVEVKRLLNHYITIVADEALSKFMEHRWIDGYGFHELVTGLLGIAYAKSIHSRSFAPIQKARPLRRSASLAEICAAHSRIV